MALGTPAHLGAGGTDVADNATTGSFTPTANAQLYAFGGARASVSMGDPTITDTATLTWSSIVISEYDIGSGVRMIMRAWRATAPSSPSSMTVTTTITSGARTAVAVFECTGALNSVTNFDDGQDASAGDPAITLPNAPAASSIVIGAFCGGGGANIAIPAGFTAELSDNFYGTTITLSTAYDVGSPLTSFAYSTGFTQPCVAIGFEIVAAGGAANVEAMGWIG